MNEEVRKADYEVTFRFKGVFEPTPEPESMRRFAEIIVDKFKDAPFTVTLHQIRELEIA